MGHKSKYSAEEKQKIVEDCLNGRDNPSHIKKTQGICEKTIRRWIAKYKAEGPTAFLTAEKNRRYSGELKKKVVEEYLSGESNVLELMSKYSIRHERQIHEWIKIYNNRGDFKQIVEGGSYTVKARSTTQEERLGIVKDCIEKGLSYSEAAVKYQVSYQQVRSWVLRYKEMGEAGKAQAGVGGVPEHVQGRVRQDRLGTWTGRTGIRTARIGTWVGQTGIGIWAGRTSVACMITKHIHSLCPLRSLWLIEIRRGFSTAICRLNQTCRICLV